MELPIVEKTSGAQQSPEALVRAMKRSAVVLGRMVAEEATLDGATVFINPNRPAVRSANFATEVLLPDEAEPYAMLDGIANWFNELGGTCLELDSATLDWPAALAEAAEARGYAPAQP
jgi:hypothetical protein